MTRAAGAVCGVALGAAALCAGCGRSAPPPVDAPAQALPASAPAATPAAPASAASMPTVRSDQYDCEGGEAVRADFYQTDAGPSFVVLHWRGHAYGLAQALSASGARYVGLVGATPEKGLEWWVKGSSATLSEVNRQDADDSRTLLECEALTTP